MIKIIAALLFSLIFLVSCNEQNPSDSLGGDPAPAESVEENQTTDSNNNQTTTTIAPSCDENGSPFGGGDGTSNNPYTICTVNHLHAIRTYLSDAAHTAHFKTLYQYLSGGSYYSQSDVPLASSPPNPLNDHFILESNIDLTSEPDFAPLGFLYGSFDGNNKTISHLTYAAPGDPSGAADIISHAAYSVGLFDEVMGTSIHTTTIKNLTLSNVNIDVSDGQFVGSLAGFAWPHTKFSRITVNTVNLKAAKKLGGLVGAGYAQIIDSGLSGIVLNARQTVGGLIGKNYGQHARNSVTSTITLRNPYWEPPLGHVINAGGYAGHHAQGNIEDSSTQTSLTLPIGGVYYGRFSGQAQGILVNTTGLGSISFQ